MQRPTRSAKELLDNPFSFSQRRPTSQREFVTALRDRGTNIRLEQIDALTQAGLIQPIFQVVGEGQDAIEAIPALTIQQAYALAGIATLRETTLLYSHYQLLLAPMIRDLLAHLMADRSTPFPYEYHFRAEGLDIELASEPMSLNSQLVVVLGALEARYLPQIGDPISTPTNWDSWRKFVDNFDPERELNFLGCDAEWVRETAVHLLARGRGLDPLDNWSELVARIRPERWDLLRNDALVAIDHKIAAEILLLFYEDLAEHGLAEPLESIPRFAPSRLDPRLSYRPRSLDSVLTDFGLSTHPSLVLVVEGPGDLFIIESVMDLLGVPRRREFIDVVDSGGVDRNIDLFCTYMAEPALDEELQTGTTLVRPATRFVRVVDPERDFSTDAKRNLQREKLVNLIFNNFPRKLQTQRVRSQLDMLVDVQTWNGSDSLEFAHFSDDEIAKAIQAVYRGSTQISFAQLVQDVRAVRTRPEQRLKSIWEKKWAQPYPSKLDLAEMLWPYLHERILATNDDTGALRDIPVVRIVLQAYEWATEFGRHSLMIATEDDA